MSNTQAGELKKLAKSLAHSLKAQGHPVPYSVLLHAMAATHGESNWHVLLKHKAETKHDELRGIPIIHEKDPPLSRWHLARQVFLGKPIQAIIPVDMETFADIELLNDFASEKITGSSVALTGIGYEIANVFFSPQQIAVLVSAESADLDDDWYLDTYREDADEYVTCRVEPGKNLLSQVEGRPAPFEGQLSLFDGRLSTRESIAGIGQAYVRFGDACLTLHHEYEEAEAIDRLVLTPEGLDTFRRWALKLKPVPKQPTLLGLVHDKHTDKECLFDAEAWFTEAADSQIIALTQSKFEDQALLLDVLSSSKDIRVAGLQQLLASMETADKLNLFITLDARKALAWLKAHRPELLPDPAATGNS